MRKAERMVYRAEDLMGFTLVDIDERRQGIVCQRCTEVVVQVEFNSQVGLAAILEPCVEHRRTCPEAVEDDA
jgi:hypothetical protein